MDIDSQRFFPESLGVSTLSRHLWRGRQLTVACRWTAQRLWLGLDFVVTIDGSVASKSARDFEWIFIHEGHEVRAILSLPKIQRPLPCTYKIAVDNDDLGFAHVIVTGTRGHLIALTFLLTVVSALVLCSLHAVI